MTNTKQKMLKYLLKDFDKVFDEKLWLYPHGQIHLDLQPNAIPVALYPYPVAYSNEEMFKDKLRHLLDNGVLELAIPTERQ